MKKFEKKTGRNIRHPQRISDIKSKLGISWQKQRRRTTSQLSDKSAADRELFVKRERRNARRKQWFVDQIHLPDRAVSGFGYGYRGEGAPKVDDKAGNGYGTAICSCNWAVGIGPSQYVRCDGEGLNREKMQRYLKKNSFQWSPKATSFIWIVPKSTLTPSSGQQKRSLRKKKGSGSVFPTTIDSLDFLTRTRTICEPETCLVRKEGKEQKNCCPKI